MGPVSPHERVKAENFFWLMVEKGIRFKAQEGLDTPAAGLKKEGPRERYGKELNSAKNQNQFRTDSSPKSPVRTEAPADTLILSQ